jgi:hypothetical protein
MLDKALSFRRREGLDIKRVIGKDSEAEKGETDGEDAFEQEYPLHI